VPSLHSGRNEWSEDPWVIPALLPPELNWSGKVPEPSSGSLAADVHEDKDHYYVCFEVPGIKREDLRLELKDRMLTVSGQRFWKRGEGEAGQALHRTIAIPASIVWDDITARLEDGILTVTLPKTEHIKPRTIELS
jgi:HSP20 family protein